MKTYIVKQYHLYVATYEVEAESEGDAVGKVFSGPEKPLNVKFEAIAEDYGINYDDNREIADVLWEKYDILCGGEIIDSLASVDEKEIT